MKYNNSKVHLIDSHAHLFFDGIYEILDEKLDSAREAGVDYILTVGTDSLTMMKNIEIAERYKNICCSIGIHPYSYNDGYDMNKLITLSNHPKVVAIGEVGLDYHTTVDSCSINNKLETSREDQIKLLHDMLSLSEKSSLPCIIHARECFDDIFNIMDDHSIKNAVFHCFTDSKESAKKILDRNYYISFTGVITFKRSDSLREIVKYVPEDRILVETDCPYLAPVPYRGKQNEPSLVRIVAEYVADLRNTTLEHISEITTNNFFKLFIKSKSILI